MADAFTLTIPVAADFRSLVPDVAGRYAELAGGSGADGAAFAAALVAAIARVESKVGADASMDLAFRVEDGRVQVHVTCGAHRESVTAPLPAPKR
jgi:hypothetical protein